MKKEIQKPWSYHKAYNEELEKMRTQAGSEYKKLKRSALLADKAVEETIKKNLYKKTK